MIPPVDRLLFKVAASCNLACRYCYWFKDQRVHGLPGVASDDVLHAFLVRLEEHIRAERSERFGVSLHGGEPMLLGFKGLIGTIVALRMIEQRTGTRLDISLQTNGTLIDHRWARGFKDLGVSVGLSIDGPQAVHDLSRITVGGGPSYAAVVKGFNALRAASVVPSILMVYTPQLTVSHLVEVLETFETNWLDVLIPDATWAEREQPEITFFPELVEFWQLHLKPRGVHIRFAANVFDLLSGKGSTSESMGGAPCRTFSVESDGKYALLDVLNVVGCGAATTTMSLQSHSIADFLASDAFRWQIETSARLPDECARCVFASSCGGGYFPSRWAPDAGYVRKSANCRTLYASFERACHIMKLASQDDRTQAKVSEQANGLNHDIF